MTQPSNPVPPQPPVQVLPADRPRGGNGWMIFLVIVVVAIGLIFLVRFYFFSSDSSTTTQPTTQASRAVPVVVAVAKKRDMPIYVDGLGTAAALNTVTVRTRVDGQLVKVYFVEGQLVKEGDPLAEVDPRAFQVQLDQAQGQLAKDQALLNNAKLDVNRYETAREAISQQQLDTAKSLVAQFTGALAADQAQIDSANLQLSYAHITAPISGKIGLRVVDQGNMVHPTDSAGLAVITQMQPISVLFSLPEDNLQRILKAAAGSNELSVEAFSRDLKNKLATGKLAAIDNQIDQATGTARFKAIFDNADQSLFPNQFVNVRLLVDTIKDAVVIPSAGVQRSPQGTFLYVVKEDKTVESRPVTLGPTEGDRTIIEQGLAENETVVTDGADKLKPGMAVTPRTAEQRGGGSTTRPSTRKSQ